MNSANYTGFKDKLEQFSDKTDRILGKRQKNTGYIS
jgi:hypothetical protein